ncbi:MAG TPA: hypothetical protein QF753_05330 [Victivallales bacterium]|nr:hypothetical protein [Victivallales bacterium]
MIKRDRTGNEKSLFDILKYYDFNLGQIRKYNVVELGNESNELFLNVVERTHGTIGTSIEVKLNLDTVRKFAIFTLFSQAPNGSGKLPVKICFLNWGDYHKTLWKDNIDPCLKLAKISHEITELDSLFLGVVDLPSIKMFTKSISELERSVFDFTLSILNYNGVI